MNLVVKQPFETYQIGDIITDQLVIAAILETEQSHYVVKIAAQVGAE